MRWATMCPNLLKKQIRRAGKGARSSCRAREPFLFFFAHIGGANGAVAEEGSKGSPPVDYMLGGGMPLHLY